MKVDYDVITVGGGLGGAVLAKVLAGNGVLNGELKTRLETSG